jgi:hypothetical protein
VILKKRENWNWYGCPMPINSQMCSRRKVHLPALFWELYAKEESTQTCKRGIPSISFITVPVIFYKFFNSSTPTWKRGIPSITYIIVSVLFYNSSILQIN